LPNAKEALEIVKSGIDEKYASYSNTQVRSTISGTILDIPVKVGNSVIQANTFNDGTTIAAVANLKDMIFIGTIDETEVGKLKENMPIVLKIGAIQNQDFAAKLEYISPKGADNNGAIVFEIKAAAVIPDSVEIRSGYSANADIILAQSKDVLTIPERCIVFEDDKSYVYLLKTEKPKQEFEKKEVTIGMSDGINIEIKSGIEATDKVRGSEVDKSKGKQ
jgi:HlyD family secretion protein